MTEEKPKKVRWYYRPAWIVIAILTAGPFALPLVWLSPSLKRWQKILITIVLVSITLWLINVIAEIYRALIKEMADLQDVYNH
jgi:hypothetical protein